MIWHRKFIVLNNDWPLNKSQGCGDCRMKYITFYFKLKTTCSEIASHLRWYHDRSWHHFSGRLIAMATAHIIASFCVNLWSASHLGIDTWKAMRIHKLFFSLLYNLGTTFIDTMYSVSSTSFSLGRFGSCWKICCYAQCIVYLITVITPSQVKGHFLILKVESQAEKVCEAFGTLAFIGA